MAPELVNELLVALFDAGLDCATVGQTRETTQGIVTAHGPGAYTDSWRFFYRIFYRIIRHEDPSAVTRRHGPATNSLVSGTIGHCATRAVMPFGPHNPKVAGPNPAPATMCSLKVQVRDLGLHRWGWRLPGPSMFSRMFNRFCAGLPALGRTPPATSASKARAASPCMPGSTSW